MLQTISYLVKVIKYGENSMEQLKQYNCEKGYTQNPVPMIFLSYRLFIWSQQTTLKVVTFTVATFSTV